MPKTDKPKTQVLKVEKTPEIEGKRDFKVLYNSPIQQEKVTQAWHFLTS